MGRSEGYVSVVHVVDVLLLESGCPLAIVLRCGNELKSKSCILLGQSCVVKV